MDIYVVAKLFGNKRVNTNVQHTQPKESMALQSSI